MNLLPGELVDFAAFEEKAETEEESGAETSWSLAEPTSSHVLAGLAESIPQEARDTLRFSKTIQVLPDDNASVILSLAGSDSPLVIEKQVDLGSVIFFATTADRDWSNLVVHPLFPMLMQQTITHLTNRSTGMVKGNLSVSESDVSQISAESLEEAVASMDVIVIPPKASNLSGIVKETRKGTEISRALLILALLVFILQGFLAMTFTKRMTATGDSDLQQSLRKHTVVAARRT